MRLIRQAVPVLAVTLVSACGAIVDSLPLAKQSNADPSQPIESVPRAACGPGSKEETGIQGQVSREDRESGRSLEGYSCNLELVGKAQHGEGASWQFAWYDDCGYYGTLMSESRQTEQGAVVIDASNPAQPFVSAILSTPAVMDPHESLKVNERRALLGAADLDGPFFDFYDLSGDCAKPRLLASVEFTGALGHEGGWAPDGLTYYGTNSNGRNNAGGTGHINAVDVTDPTTPQLVHEFGQGTHGLSLSEDGTRAYLAKSAPNAPNASPTGLVILDVSDVQARKPNPVVTTVGTVSWSDGFFQQHTIPVTIQGRSYVVFVDEGGRGAARIIDISDETSPFIASRVKLEVHLAENAGLDVRDAGTPLFVYDGHYCSVDQQIEPTVLGCGYFESGIRVFDIRNPLAPKEIAYYNPPPINDRPLPGSSHGGGTADRCAAQVRFVPERGELWTMCQDNEFMVLRFTNGVWPFRDAT